jgi:hypothetical protein
MRPRDVLLPPRQGGKTTIRLAMQDGFSAMVSDLSALGIEPLPLGPRLSEVVQGARAAPRSFTERVRLFFATEHWKTHGLDGIEPARGNLERPRLLEPHQARRALRRRDWLGWVVVEHLEAEHAARVTAAWFEANSGEETRG